MLIIEWLMRLPRADGIVVVREMPTHASTSSDAVAEANSVWMALRSSDGHRPDGFQIMDQDGRILLGPHFLQREEFGV